MDRPGGVIDILMIDFIKKDEDDKIIMSILKRKKIF